MKHCSCFDGFTSYLFARYFRFCHFFFFTVQHHKSLYFFKYLNLCSKLDPLCLVNVFCAQKILPLKVNYKTLKVFIYSTAWWVGRLWAVERLSSENHPLLIVVFTLAKNNYERWEKIQKLSFFPTAQSRFKLG